MSTGGDDIFSRWSERRKAVAAEVEQEAGSADAPLPADDMPPDDPRPEAEILEDLGLTDPDAMELGDDFSGFMREGVPMALRQRALRRLWRLNPLLANVDGLVDYGDDFTDAATVIPDLKTVYRVGKGMLKDILEEPQSEAAPDDEADQIAQAQEDDREGFVETAPDDEDSGEEDVVMAPIEPIDEITPMPAPRRMAFRFED